MQGPHRTLNATSLSRSHGSRRGDHTTAVALIATVAFWASSYVAIRIGLRFFGAGELALLRYMIASIALGFVACRTASIGTLVRDRRALAIAAVSGITGIALYNVLLNAGEQTLPSAEASFLVSASPIFTAILAGAILREQFGYTAWAGSALAFTGVATIALDGHDHFRVGTAALAVLGAAVLQAASFILQRNVLHVYGALEVTAVSIWSGALSLFLFSPGLVQELQAAAWTPMLTAVYLGLFPGALGYVCWSKVLSAMPSSRAAQFLYLVPMSTLVLGWLVLAEQPRATDLTGGLLILLGVAVTRVPFSQVKAMFMHSFWSKKHGEEPRDSIACPAAEL